MAVVVLDDGSDASKQVSVDLNLPLQADPQTYYLAHSSEGWEIRDPRQGQSFRLRFNWDADFEMLKKQKINPKKDLLCRALSFKGGAAMTIMDGTLGMGKDTLHLLTCGAEVVAVERHPLIYFLQSQALKRSQQSLSLQILQGETKDRLSEWAYKIDGLYLDPMFENAKKKSAPKKGLAFLREVATEDQDVQGVIARAIELGVKRVVVKRPYRGEHLYGKPNNIFEGKLIRYDVYTR